MTISAVLIVKNEGVLLNKCLKSLINFDEIIICDTGSEDNTIEIAKKYTDKVFTDYKWNDNFAEARNHAVSKATSDWILIIDADDELVSTVDNIKKEIATAESKGIKAIDCIIESMNSKNIHYQPRLYKRCPEIYWCGAIHNHLSVVGGMKGNTKVRYAYSPAHAKDPDRALRILKKEVAKGDRIRELYYLAREYWYRKDYITAIYWWDEYLAVSKFLPERADAYLMVARCYWALKKGETARHYCLMALSINSHFREAILLMAEMSWPRNADQWKKMAETADNKSVLFIRG
jgi:glycosyltransferase involved in cell wall biosynthesis